jgi:hypothetical protein
MPNSVKPVVRIEARVLIAGPAEEILSAVRLLHGGKRSVHLSIEVSTRHYSDRDHYLPAIKDGQTQAAVEKLELMSRQTIVDDETDRRLERLIREFGEFTAR